MPAGQHSDIFAALRPSKVAVVVFGRRWELHLQNAYEWLGALGHDLDGLTGVIPGSILDVDVEAMLELSAHHDDADRRWLNAARVATQKGGGRDWWWTVNLTRKCLAAWPYINGRLLHDGVHAQQLLFPDWLDAAYMLLWMHSDEKDRIKLDLELSLPPAGVAIRQTPVQKKKMLEDFAAD